MIIETSGIIKNEELYDRSFSNAMKYFENDNVHRVDVNADVRTYAEFVANTIYEHKSFNLSIINKMLENFETFYKDVVSYTDIDTAVKSRTYDKILSIAYAYGITMLAKIYSTQPCDEEVTSTGLNCLFEKINHAMSNGNEKELQALNEVFMTKIIYTIKNDMFMPEPYVIDENKQVMNYDKIVVVLSAHDSLVDVKYPITYAFTRNSLKGIAEVYRLYLSNNKLTSDKKIINFITERYLLQFKPMFEYIYNNETKEGVDVNLLNKKFPYLYCLYKYYQNAAADPVFTRCELTVIYTPKIFGHTKRFIKLTDLGKIITEKWLCF